MLRPAKRYTYDTHTASSACVIRFPHLHVHVHVELLIVCGLLMRLQSVRAQAHRMQYSSITDNVRMMLHA